MSSRRTAEPTRKAPPDRPPPARGPSVARCSRRASPSRRSRGRPMRAPSWLAKKTVPGPRRPTPRPWSAPSASPTSRSTCAAAVTCSRRRPRVLARAHTGRAVIRSVPVAIRQAHPADAETVAAIYNEGVGSAARPSRPRPAQPPMSTPGAGRAGRAHPAAGGRGRRRGERLGPRSSPTASARRTGGIGPPGTFGAPPAAGASARALLTGLAASAEKVGYWKLTGKLFTENDASFALVRRCGWREVGTPCVTVAWRALARRDRGGGPARRRRLKRRPARVRRARLGAVRRPAPP